MLCMHVYYNAETDRIIIYCDREQIRYEGTEVDLLYCKCCCSRISIYWKCSRKTALYIGFSLSDNKCKATVERDVYSCLSISSLFYKEFRYKNGMEMTQSTVILKI